MWRAFLQGRCMHFILMILGAPGGLMTIDLILDGYEGKNMCTRSVFDTDFISELGFGLWDQWSERFCRKDVCVVFLIFYVHGGDAWY